MFEFSKNSNFEIQYNNFGWAIKTFITRKHCIQSDI